MVRDSSTSLGMTKKLSRCRRRSGCFPSANQPVDAPPPRAVKDHEEKNPAIKDGQLAMVRKLFARARDWEKFCHRCGGTCHMYHEVGVGKHTTADKRGQTREQPEGNHEPAYELNPPADLSDHFIRARHS